MHFVFGGNKFMSAVLEKRVARGALFKRFSATEEEAKHARG